MRVRLSHGMQVPAWRRRHVDVPNHRVALFSLRGAFFDNSVVTMNIHHTRYKLIAYGESFLEGMSLSGDARWRIL